ncbi:class I SAM-dependent methyltransferase [Asticcacaulis sp. AC402]|uniref:class I SAM-dependent methyltransferase n=1 Tax=Asticcacaulis sp. AC402 TaxID=1282361 RepID=UPI0003C3F3F3|nr:class I SAM-dependent methyltransferase [Asticcacaulis sp. AC402]ESQ74884.1 O-methyltransferase [Asticcacaulis sp. AC402]
MPIRRHVLAALLGTALIATPALANHHEDKALHDAVAGSWRSAENKARDSQRHPIEALSFWGLKPGMTIFEVNPGAKGWWTEILAPYAHTTGGVYAAAMGKTDDPAFWAAVADKSIYGEVKAYPLSGSNFTSLPANSADMILVARAFHSWARQGQTTDNYMGAFYGALKPGGILAVEQHRAPEGSDPMAGTGYVPESYVIAAAKKAGFVLEDRSEINANPKDTRDHPFGVWTLKPVRSSKNDSRTLTPEERAAFDAIGESDRMTLRFRKPA